MSKGTASERYAKHAAKIDRAVDAGKITRAEADKRKADSRASIFGGGAQVGGGSGNRAIPQTVVRRRTPQTAAQVVLPSAERGLDLPHKYAANTYHTCQWVDLVANSDAGEAFNNVSLLNVTVRTHSTLGATPTTARIVFGFSGTIPKNDTSFSEVEALKGSISRSGQVASPLVFAPPSGVLRTLFRGGKRVKVADVEPKLYFAVAVEYAAPFDGEKPVYTFKVVVQYQCGGGPRIVVKTDL